MKIQDFSAMKLATSKISMITCYDYTLATILADTDIDAILVGDSASTVMHGLPNTLLATVEMMVFHTRAVAAGAANKFIIGDMPFLSYRKDLPSTLEAMGALMQAGANAIKLEGILGHEKAVMHAVQSGIPVMGHLGLTPQSVHQLGGYKVQGRDDESARLIKEQAIILEDAGCFALVLECIPEELGKEITDALSIPTIGIGAGVHVDGQVLVLQDLLGMNTDFKPKFVKPYFNGYDAIVKAINLYDEEVKSKVFPSQEFSFVAKIKECVNG